MNLSIAMLVLLALTGAAFVQDVPNPPLKPSQADVDSPVALVERLAQQTRHVPWFTAKYHGVSMGSAFDMRLVYRAPDDARFEILGEEQTVVCWVLDGHVFIHVDGQEGTFASDLDLKSMFEQNSGFLAVLEAEFPTPGDHDLGAGPIFSLWPANAKESSNSFDGSVNWFTPRNHLLAWLDRPRAWANAKQVDGNLVRELQDGSHVALSLRTGFIESISRPNGSHLELTDFSKSIDEDEFVIPASKPGAKDVMAKMKAGLPARADLMRRALIYQRVSYEKDTTGEEFQTKVAKVFDALFKPDMAAWHTRLIQDWGTYVDSYATWSRDRFKRTSSDAAAREELRQQIAERRAFYDREMEKVLQGHVFEMRGLEELGLTAELIGRVHAVERETFESVGRRAAADPFLRKFDAAIADAESGK